MCRPFWILFRRQNPALRRVQKCPKRVQISRGICTPEDRLDSRFSCNAHGTNWIEVTKLVRQSQIVQSVMQDYQYDLSHLLPVRKVNQICKISMLMTSSIWQSSLLRCSKGQVRCWIGISQHRFLQGINSRLTGIHICSRPVVRDDWQLFFLIFLFYIFFILFFL